MAQKSSIPDGAIKIHLYPYKKILKPRGSMGKESLGLLIYERLTGNYKSWTNPKYGDNPNKTELIDQLKKNLLSEVETAWDKFINNKEGNHVE